MIRLWTALFLVWFGALVGRPAPFLVYSCPKCGTHLLEKAIHLLTGELALEENTGSRRQLILSKMWQRYPVAHIWPEALLEEVAGRSFKVVLGIRDPRDQIVSFYHWFRKGEKADFGHPAGLRARMLVNRERQIDEWITGDLFGFVHPERGIGKAFDVVSQLPAGRWHLCKFEDLVGEKGGGDRSRQVDALRALAHFLEVDLPDERIEEIADTLFGGSKTFRKGVMGQYKTFFTPRQIELFAERHSGLMNRLGYDL